jgi:hypothetical protein
MFTVAGGILIAVVVIVGLMLLVPAIGLVRKVLRTEISDETPEQWAAKQPTYDEYLKKRVRERRMDSAAESSDQPSLRSDL